jgi:hypothetical protein
MKADEKRCPDCAEAIKKDATVCKHCGRPFTSNEIAAGRKELQKRRWGCAAAVVGALLFVIYAGTQNTPSTGANSVESGSGAAENTGSNIEPGSNSKWNYSEQRDEMRNRTDKFAELTSENEQEFSFPYSGGSHLTIELQKYRKPETEVMLRLEKGQFICHSYTGGSVSVRFDGGPVRKFACSDTSDADTTTIFLRPAGSFVAALKKSSKMTVEAEFFQEGIRQYTFDTRGLSWH